MLTRRFDSGAQVVSASGDGEVVAGPAAATGDARIPLFVVSSDGRLRVVTDTGPPPAAAPGDTTIWLAGGTP